MSGGRSGQQSEASYGLGGFSLGSLVSGVSGALETASSKVRFGLNHKCLQGNVKSSTVHCYDFNE